MVFDRAIRSRVVTQTLPRAPANNKGEIGHVCYDVTDAFQIVSVVFVSVASGIRRDEKTDAYLPPHDRNINIQIDINKLNTN